MCLAPVQHIIDAERDLLLGRDFANRRNAAVADPRMPAVCTGAIQNDVRFRELLGALVVAHEESKRNCPAFRHRRRLGLEHSSPDQ